MTRQCLKCKKRFEPKNGNQVVCSFECARDKAKADREKKDKENYKIERLETAKKKRELVTKGQLEKKLQTEINHIARLIDHGVSCISCNGKGKPQAGHYHTTKARPAIRFHLDNIHIQDYYCNVELSSNITGYNKGLIERYGQEYKDFVEVELPKSFPLLQLGKPYLIDKIVEARKIVRELEKDLRVRGADERLMLRKKVNERLCIYI